MEILGWRDLLSAKWLTALNTDVNGRLFFIPIKHLLGDYFVAKINGHIFAFEMGYQQIKTYVATASTVNSSPSHRRRFMTRAISGRSTPPSKKN